MGHRAFKDRLYAEFAGYGAVSLAALASGYLAATYALRPQPFYLGVAFALAGLLLSVVFLRDSHGHARQEARELSGGKLTEPAPQPSFREILLLVSWKNPSLFAASQAGLVNNLNDGLAWGLFPLYFAAAGLAVAMVLLGVGTALVYPTLLAAISDVAHPEWRASAVGVYRLWRDGGYAVGALLAGVIADLVGVPWATAVIAALTFASGVVVFGRMQETLPGRQPAAAAERQASARLPEATR